MSDLEIIIDEEDGAKFVSIGDFPEDNDASWNAADKLYDDVLAVIKGDFTITPGEGENSFVCDGNEFKYLRGEFDPLTVYAYESAGNVFIDKLAELLKTKL
jgi:hypothetical protein